MKPNLPIYFRSRYKWIHFQLLKFKIFHWKMFQLIFVVICNRECGLSLWVLIVIPEISLQVELSDRA